MSFAFPTKQYEERRRKRVEREEQRSRAAFLMMEKSKAQDQFMSKTALVPVVVVPPPSATSGVSHNDEDEDENDEDENEDDASPSTPVPTRLPVVRRKKRSALAYRANDDGHHDSFTNNDSSDSSNSSSGDDDGGQRTGAVKRLRRRRRDSAEMSRNPPLKKQRRRRRQRQQQSSSATSSDDGDTDESSNDEQETTRRSRQKTKSFAYSLVDDEAGVAGNDDDDDDIEAQEQQLAATADESLLSVVDASELRVGSRLEPMRSNGYRFDDHNSHTACIVVQRDLLWPTLYTEMTVDEANWLLLYMENMWKTQSDDAAYHQRVQERRHRVNGEGTAYEASNDEDDDDDDGDGDDDVVDPYGGVPRRGPGRFRGFTLRYTLAQLREKRAFDIACERFGVESDRPLDPEHVEMLTKGMHKYVLQVKAILTRHIEEAAKRGHDEFEHAQRGRHANDRPSIDQFITDDGIPPHTSRRLARIHHQISNARGLLRAAVLMESPHSAPNGLPIDLRVAGLVSGSKDNRKAEDGMEFSQLYLRERVGECYRNRWKRFGDMLYKETTSPNGHRTQAYQPHVSIQKFVYSAPDLFEDTERWGKLTKKQNTFDWMEKMLTKMHFDGGDYLPDVERSRYQWSFRNGIYCALNDKFYEYTKSYHNDADCPFVTRTDSAKYFDVEFPLEIVTQPPNKIRVKSVETILQSQNLDAEVRGWIWALFGRMFYKVGEYDNWQVMPYFQGKAGTGKSTLVEMFQHVYEPINVGTLANNMEEKFGLQDMWNKFIVLGAECRPDFKLDQANFQQMTSGERMAIARKNKGVMEVECWSAPIMLAGNVFPKWINSGGSLDRRIIAILFETKVPENKTMPDLQRRIREEIAQIIVKANRFYRAAIGRYAKKNIWQVLPAALKAGREALRQDIDPLAQFVGDCRETEDTEYFIELEQFLQVMGMWGTTHGNFKFSASNKTLVSRLQDLGVTVRAVDDGEGSKIYRIFGRRVPHIYENALSASSGSGAPPAHGRRPSSERRRLNAPPRKSRSTSRLLVRERQREQALRNAGV